MLSLIFGRVWPNFHWLAKWELVFCVQMSCGRLKWCQHAGLQRSLATPPSWLVRCLCCMRMCTTCRLYAKWDLKKDLWPLWAAWQRLLGMASYARAYDGEWGSCCHPAPEAECEEEACNNFSADNHQEACQGLTLVGAPCKDDPNPSLACLTFKSNSHAIGATHCKGENLSAKRLGLKLKQSCTLPTHNTLHFCFMELHIYIYIHICFIALDHQCSILNCNNPDIIINEMCLFPICNDLFFWSWTVWF